MSLFYNKGVKKWPKTFPASVSDNLAGFTHRMENLPTVVSAGQSEREVVVSVGLPLWKESVRQILCQKGVRGGVCDIK